MSAPYIERNQTIQLFQGKYTRIRIQISGKYNIKCVAYGLPKELEITDNGVIFGTPTSYGTRSAYIIATNDYGTDSAIVNFQIERIMVDFSMEISPPFGYSLATGYKFVSNAVEALDGYTFKWNFGDGKYSDEPSPTHIYETPGTYQPSLDIHYNDIFFKSVSGSVDVHMLINESIYFEEIPPPTFAGHLNRWPFRIIYTSSKDGPHYIDLGVQYSRSYEHQNPVNKWSFLRPEWKFLDYNKNVLDHVIPTNYTKLYANEIGKINHNGEGLFVGVTGFVDFYFIDDMHNFDLVMDGLSYSTIIATLRTSGIKAKTDSINIDGDIPGYANSLATTQTPYMTLLRVPDYLRITENGIRDYINPRWKGAKQPIVAYLNWNYRYPSPFGWDDGGLDVTLFKPESVFSHAFPIASGDIIPINLEVLELDSNFTPSPTELRYEDENNFRTSGYYKGSFVIDNVDNFTTKITGSTTIEVQSLSGQFFNPYMWLSNPEAGMMTTAQYVVVPPSSGIVTSKNQNIAITKNFYMPIQTTVDFEKDPMALSGFHGVYSIAAMQFPEYHAWALDSELNFLYRIDTRGTLLCAININELVQEQNLGFLVEKQVSPISMVLDSGQNIWITLHDTVSTIKLDRWGNFLFAINPYTAMEYSFPPKPDISDEWYSQSSFYQLYSDSQPYGSITGLPHGHDNIFNDIDIKPFVEPNFVDTDTKDNVWISYSTAFSGYVMKHDPDGNLLFTYSYPVCSAPQQLVVDTSDNVWIAISNNIWESKTFVEKRSSAGVLLSTFGPFRGLNYITLDMNENLWFTHGYSWVGRIENATGNVFTTDLSGSDYTVHAADWFNPNLNTDETALEGIACDMKNRILVINSLENQVYILDGNTTKFLHKFYVNPQGLGYYIDDQQGDQYAIYNIWNKSLQASGDWTGLRWFSKYKEKLPYYIPGTLTLTLTGESVPLEFYVRKDYELFKKNENFEFGDHIKSLARVPGVYDSKHLFESFMDTIYGVSPYSHIDLGVSAFEKISNFVMNNADIDTCDIDKIYSLAREVGVDIENFNFRFPISLKRVMDYCSINQSRLYGANSVQQDYFTDLNINGNINLGDKIESLTYSVTAGDKLVLKDRTLEKYRVIETYKIEDQSEYSIQTLAEFLNLDPIEWKSYYEFYKFIPVYDNRQLEGVIDWENPQTTLRRTLSSKDYWIGDENIMDMHISYEIYKGLGLIK